MKTKLIWSAIIVLLYLIIKYLFPYAMIVLYPIALIVTFLHELGHSVFALITGGDVFAVQINPDGSGFAKIAGGWTALVLMGGYIGSALFGNLLFYIGFMKPNISRVVVTVLGVLMIFVAIWWFSSLFTTILLLSFAALLIYLAGKKQHVSSYLLLVTGLLSIIYIIEDYNVGPTSDLHKFAEVVPILPEYIWMYGFLIVVLFLTYLNLRTIVRHTRNS